MTDGHSLPTTCAGPDDGWERVAEAARWARPDDLFLVQPTSGSTGVPKLLARPHRAFARYATFVGAELAGLPHRPRVLAAALTHAFGMHLLVTAIALGAALDVPARSTPPRPSTRSATWIRPSFQTTPGMLRSLVRQARDFDRPPGPGVRTVGTRSAKAPADVPTRSSCATCSGTGSTSWSGTAPVRRR